jgi:hypothetical protein
MYDTAAAPAAAESARSEPPVDLRTPVMKVTSGIGSSFGSVQRFDQLWVELAIETSEKHERALANTTNRGTKRKVRPWKVLTDMYDDIGKLG